MNSTRSQPAGDASKLAVLGLLSMTPNHGYGLRAILESWQVHRWADIKYGSIYAALKRFDDVGLVELVRTDADKGPSRSTYRITEAGREALADLTRRAWTEPPRWSTETNFALMFLALDWMGTPILERAELQDLLDRRLTVLGERIKELQDTAHKTMSASPVPPLRELQRFHFDHGVALLEAEREWTRSVKAALAAGRFDVKTA